MTRIIAMASLERLGFIGLGNMGGAIALRLLRAGYPLTILDLDTDKMAGLIKEGATTAATPREVAE
ncbi:MAG TPA: NAD(P)-binding domain-containing protein, partial [Methylomirabilota bacterium]|nr:NAD(P)-binding domain-containing protein [Methylomirabilota bacterium]